MGGPPAAIISSPTPLQVWKLASLIKTEAFKRPENLDRYHKMSDAWTTMTIKTFFEWGYHNNFWAKFFFPSKFCCEMCNEKILFCKDFIECNVRMGATFASSINLQMLLLTQNIMIMARRAFTTILGAASKEKKLLPDSMELTITQPDFTVYRSFSGTYTKYIGVD